MPKYYIKCGSLEIIYSTSKKPIDAAIDALWETNENDVVDDTFYIDERGFRGYVNSDDKTVKIALEKVARRGGWELE